jgi:hypothetical protein
MVTEDTGEKQAVKVAVALLGDGVVELEQALHRLVEHVSRHAGIPAATANA